MSSFQNRYSGLQEIKFSLISRLMDEIRISKAQHDSCKLASDKKSKLAKMEAYAHAVEIVKLVFGDLV
jgi:hypothetical protein